MCKWRIRTILVSGHLQLRTPFCLPSVSAYESFRCCNEKTRTILCLDYFSHTRVWTNPAIFIILQTMIFTSTLLRKIPHTFRKWQLLVKKTLKRSRYVCGSKPMMKALLAFYAIQMKILTIAFPYPLITAVTTLYLLSLMNKGNSAYLTL